MKTLFPWGVKILAIMVSGSVLGACTIGDVTRGGDSSTVQVDTDALPGQAQPLKQLVKISQDVQADRGGRIGIAVATGEDVIQVGELGNSPAWSTIKVPLAIAADRARLVEPELIEAAISESDNDSAYVMRTLVEDLDFADVPALDEPMGFTRWPLLDQARFATELECLDTHGTTFEAMGNIVDWQSWGLGQIAGAHYKGGWGPDSDELYTLRQFGLVPVNDGMVGVSILVHPEDGDHGTAVLMVDEIAVALGGLIAARAFPPATACSV